MKITICDSIMGSGKTQAAIHYMNTHPTERFIFVTPYLKEIDRIKYSCPSLRFCDPHANNPDGKLGDSHRLLDLGRNIACTHKLMSRFNSETVELIRRGGYTLILDEVFDVISYPDMHQADMRVSIDAGILRSEGDKVYLADESYAGTIYKELADAARIGTLRVQNECFFFTITDKAVFESFDRILILTYMFDAQIQKYYFDTLNAEYIYIGTKRVDDHYEFTDTPEVPEYARQLKSKIHILDKPKQNAIGKKESALSATWYLKAKANHNGQLDQLQNNIYNFFRNQCKSSASEVLWTTYDDYMHALSGKGYTNGYIACNMRATNDYADRIYLAYCVNRYFNPLIKQYFLSKGIKVQEERYALSEMVQWIWRSAIRRGEEIWIYIPSIRMRTLLENWLAELSGEIVESTVKKKSVRKKKSVTKIEVAA